MSSDESVATHALAFLADARQKLAASTRDLDATLTTASACGVPFLGDVCILHVVHEPDALRLAGVHATAAAAAVAARAERVCHADGTSPAPADDPAWRSVQTASPEVDASTGWAAELLAGDARHVLVAPLKGTRARPIGALTFVTCGAAARPYDDVAVAVACELGGVAGLAVEHARVVRERDDTLSTVSHDLRNPLNVITVATAAMAGGSLTAERQKMYLEKLRRAADRMNRLIQDVLDATRIASGHTALELAPLEPGGLVGEAVDAARAGLVTEKHIALEAHVGSDLPTLHADRQRVLQVLAALLSNAAHVTPQNGTIEVCAARVDATSAAPAGVLFTVADSGPGLAPDDLHALFDRHLQARRMSRHGAGLGLAIARAIVLGHGGRIWADESPGPGARVHVFLPAATSAARGLQADPT